MVLLTPFSDEDFESLIGWIPDAESLFRWTGRTFSFPLGRAQLAAHLERIGRPGSGMRAYTARDPETGSAVGHCELMIVDREVACARMGRVLVGNPAHRGKGLGRAVVRSALRIAFDEMGMHRVELNVFPDNLGAIACYERVGFRQEGLLRHARKLGSTYHDVSIMAILEEEWRALRLGGRRILDASAPELLSGIRNLFREYAASLDFDLCFQGFEEELDGLPGAYAPPRGRLFLARIGDEDAGCVALRPLEGRIAELKRLWVRPAFRTLGVGRMLVEHALAEAVRAGYDAIRLDTVPGMDAAMMLYRALGFRKIGPYRPNPVPGALYMEKVFDGGH